MMTVMTRRCSSSEMHFCGRRRLRLIAAFAPSTHAPLTAHTSLEANRSVETDGAAVPPPLMAQDDAFHRILGSALPAARREICEGLALSTEIAASSPLWTSRGLGASVARRW